VPFEYASGLDRERALFTKLDEYATTPFVSPVLLDQPNPYEIYEESLLHFEQKCGMRDFLDLYQLLRSVCDNNVPGDIAEFGSYRGHSGYLIARTLQALGSRKHLYMFDTFAAFPEELTGIDYYWSDTHDVSFAEVRAKFRDLENVHLVRGDFIETLPQSDLGHLALAYVDCDSYRATRYLLDALLPHRMSPRGLLVCEDYGHPALLGHRVAVHESLESLGPADACFRFFSQFSGFYIVVKY
jgi:predicted O-methyltransferase YrrM